MHDDPTSLRTRWSMLEQLHGPEREAAWAWFLETYRDFVHDFVLRRLRGSRGQECCDSVWGELFRSKVPERADRERRFRGYLVGVLKNLIHAFERKNKVVAQAADEDDGDPEQIDTASLSHAAEAQDLRAWAKATLGRAMEQLGKSHPKDRQLLLEFYGLGAKAAVDPDQKGAIKDIAARLGITTNAVHQAMFKARNRLREHFVEIVRQTVETHSDLEDELRTQIASLGDTVPGLLEA